MSLVPLNVDGFWGALLGAEGILGCRAVMHGPGGCRISVAGHSNQVVIRDYAIREGPFYFTNPRIPCTYLDEEDYINGADYKLSDLLSTIEDAEVVMIIQSPGTSLIGDDLNGAAYRSGFKGEVVIIEENLISLPGHKGYDAAVSSVVHALCRKSEKKSDTINLLGLPVYTDGWEETADELRGYAEVMGLKVISVPGAGSTVQDIRESSSASLNVTILPEFCVHTIERYSHIGVGTAVLEIPIGFEGTEKWIRGLAEATGKDPAPALDLLNRSTSRASNIIKGNMGLGLKMRCTTYSMDFDSVAALPLVKWLYSYLAMFPEEIAVRPWWDEEYLSEFREFLSSIQSEDSLVEHLTPVRCDVMFGNGQTAALMERTKKCSVGIDLWPPSMHRMRFVGKPFLGARGALRMLDEMFEWAERN